MPTFKTPAAVSRMSRCRWVPIALVLLISLAGCRQEASPPVEPLPAEAAEVVEGFGLLGAAGEEYEGRASLLLRFSQPLASSQPFDERIVVKDAKGEPQSSAWILEDNGSRLRYPYLQADQHYSVTVGAELEAADGSTLGSLTETSVYSGNLPPLLTFASQGSVLPAKGSDGLPIIAVNATEADVEFYRVKPSAYSDFFARWQRGGQRSIWELDDVSRMADAVYANRFALPGEPNERTTALLPIHGIAELQPPGLYLAIMKRPGQFDGELQTTHYVVTDLGLHARTIGEQILVHVASLESGQPRGNVSIELIDKTGKVLIEGSTDGNGELTLAYRPKPEDVLIARAGSETALLPFRQPALDLSEFVVAGRPQTAMDAYAWSGRDLYRPGETLQLSVLLRDFDGRSLKTAPPLFARLRQPDGRTLAAQTLEPSALGYYSLTRLITEDAATGRWSVELRIDPDKGEPLGRFAFRVEEFLPERLKLALDSEATQLKPGDALPLRAEGAYLYGAPANGNRLKVELLYSAAIHPVLAHPDYAFGDPMISLPDGPQEAVDGKLDDKGVMQQSLNILPDSKANAPVEVRVAASLFESGGRAIRRSLKRTIWPATELVGVRPRFDPEEGAGNNQAVTFDVLRSDAEGTLSSADALEVSLIREHRDYRWSWVDGRGWGSDFIKRMETVDTQTLALDGLRPASVEVRVEWGEYQLQILDPATGLTTRYPFTAGWSWNDDNRGIDARPDKVKLALNKTGYRPGDTVEVTVTPPHPGPGVLLVESSEGLLLRESFEAQPGAQISFTVDDQWQRHDIYITALVFRPSRAASEGSPQRAVGIAHLPMTSSDRSLELTLAAPATVRPGESLTVSLTAPELAGKTGYAVVEAVDQGILSLTGYALPDAGDYFLARRALGTEARDVYGRVIERLSGERARLRYGGDAALAALPQSRRPTAKVQTVALHKAPVTFDERGKASVTFTAPEFNGALRLAALAYGESRYGKAEGEALVRAPLVVEVSTPRAMAPGDRAQLTVDVQNLSGQAQTFKIRATAGAYLRIDGGSTSIELADGERRSLHFPLRALPGEGIGHFNVTAQGGDTLIKRDFELAVRPAWPGERRARARVQEGAGSVRLVNGLLDGLMTDATRVQLSLSSIPPLPFSSAITGLIGYPYGCVEQTSSRLWPLLWFDAETARKFGMEPLDEKERQRMIDAGFSRLAALQLGNGQFGFWPGDSWAQPQMTAFVAELLLAARDAGHAIPESVLDLAIKRLGEELLTGGEGYYSYDHSAHLRFAASAHAALVLAKIGRAPLGSLRSLYQHERGKSLTALPLLQLGIALRLQGDTERGDQAIAEAMAMKSKRPGYLGDYGSDIRDEALMLALLHENQLAKPAHDARMIALARELRQPSDVHYGLSTQERLAVFRLGRQLLDGSAAPLAGQLTIGARIIDLPPVSMYSLQLSPADLDQPISLSTTGEGQTWIAEDVLGAPIKAPTPVENGMSIRRTWYAMDGSVFAGKKLKEGDTLIARLTINSAEAVPDAIVTDLLPAGLEVENLGIGDSETLQALVIDGSPLSERTYGVEIRHEEYRDDRYVAAVKLWGGGETHLYYLVRAVSPGTYAVPPPQIEDMYRPRLFGIGATPVNTLEVVAPE